MMAFKRRSRYYYHLYLMGLHILLRYIENNFTPYDLLFPSPIKPTTIAYGKYFKNESWEMTVSTPHRDLNSTLTFVGSLNQYSVAEHESLDWAPVQDSISRTPTSAPVSCLKHNEGTKIAIKILLKFHAYLFRQEAFSRADYSKNAKCFLRKFSQICRIQMLKDRRSNPNICASQFLSDFLAGGF